MIEGQTASPGPGNRITCLRSGQDAGDFVFELLLEPNARGPERHAHDEQEIIEVKRGALEVEVEGAWSRLGPGEAVTLRPGTVHTFRNASKEEPAVCICTCGPRFERLIAISSVLEVCYYMTYVDAGASRAQSAALRAVIGLIGGVARLVGVGRRVQRVV